MLLQQAVRQIHNQQIGSQQQVLQQVGQLVAQQVHNNSTTSCMQQSASLTASRTTCCRTDPQLVEVMESDTKHTVAGVLSNYTVVSAVV